MNKSAIRRRGFKSAKKKEAYLWNTQKNYIDVPMTCRWRYTFECKVIFKNFSPNNVAFSIGSHGVFSDNNGNKINWINSARTLPTPLVADTQYVIKSQKIDNSFVLTVNDIRVTSVGYFDNNSGSILRIGGHSSLSYINDYNWCLRGGIAYLKIWDGNTLIFDGTPATVDDKCGIYDAVSNTFYGNTQSWGKFTIQYI